jgi:hypothetical protein
MSQSRPSSDTEEQQPSPTSLSKGNVSASDAPSVDNFRPDPDADLSAARGAGAFASPAPCTRCSCIHPMSYLDLAIPQKREREVSLEAATPHPDDTVRTISSFALRPADPTDRNRSRLRMKIARSLL